MNFLAGVKKKLPGQLRSWTGGVVLGAAVAIAAYVFMDEAADAFHKLRAMRFEGSASEDAPVGDAFGGEV